MTIEIEDFRFKTIIGLLDFERVNEQEVIVILEPLMTTQTELYRLC